jgi:hypothetical protein
MSRQSTMGRGALALLATLVLQGTSGGVASAQSASGPRNPNLKYFGFYSGQGEVHASSLTAFDAQLAATHGFTNVVFTGARRDAIQKVKDAGKLAIVNASWDIFYEGTGADCTSADTINSYAYTGTPRERFQLSPQAATRWNAFVDSLMDSDPARDLRSTVLAVWLDEPDYNCVHAGEVQQMGALIKSRLPDAKAMVVYTGGYVDALAAHPAEVPGPGFDWLSVDAYGDFHAYEIPRLVEVLKQRKASAQSLVITADGNHLKEYADCCASEYDPAVCAEPDVRIPYQGCGLMTDAQPLGADLVQALRIRADQYFFGPAQDPAVVGVFPFLWETVTSRYDSGHLRALQAGVADIPTVLDKWRCHGAQVVNAQPPLYAGGLAAFSAPGWDVPERYQTIRYGQLDANPGLDVCGRDGTGLKCYLSGSAGTGLAAQSTPAGQLSAFSDANGWNQPKYYSTLQLADVNGDGLADACGRGPDGVKCYKNQGSGFTGAPELLGHLTSFSDANGWSQPKHYSTLQFGNLNADAYMDVCGRGAGGIECYLGSAQGLTTAGARWYAEFTDAGGWNQERYYSTLRLVDVNADDRADVCGNGPTGITCLLSTATGFTPDLVTSRLNVFNATGWERPEHYKTIQFADINADGRADVCGRGAGEFFCYLAGDVSPGFTSAAHWAGGLKAFTNAEGWAAPEYFSTIRLADLNNDQRADVCGRGPRELQCYLAQSDGKGFPESAPYAITRRADPSQGSYPGEAGGLSHYADALNWNQPRHYETLSLADVTGDGRADICGRGGGELICWSAREDDCGLRR